ncbi:hypothetical protein [Ensifer soli]|uniref:hypothetical protein n=1 Tax=Ciceribacter sp. sgz301302 TaxID=3342379 RepID=UPI0035BAEB24
MTSIRSFLMTVLGVTIAFAAFVLTASIGLALAGIALVVMVAGTVAARLSPGSAAAPAYVRTRDGRRPARVWNDGRGTIIDM